MNEQLLEELLEQVKKHNEIQESIKREMELQNDLIAYYLRKGKEVSFGTMEVGMEVEDIKAKRRN